MKNRNIGIELFRIVSMFMVVVLHVLGQGGILNAATLYQEKVAWFLEILSYPAVNCFALISGYVSLNNKFKLSRFIKLYFQIFFYSLGITLIFYFCGQGVSIREIAYSFLPLTSNMWWYISSYAILFFFSNILNKVIENSKEKELRFFFIIIFTLFTLMPLILKTNPYILNNGYSPLWLIILYLFGAYIKKYNILKNISKLKSFVIYIISSFIPWVFMFGIGYITGNFKYIGKVVLLPDTFVSYISIFVIISAVMLLSIFSKIDIKNKNASKIILIFSSSSLGVYLIHVHKLVFSLLSGKFKSYAFFSLPKLVIYVLLTALFIYLGCTLIEIIRIRVFKALKMDILANKIDKRLEKYYKD